MTTIYQQLRDQADPATRLDELIRHFRGGGRATELFEAMKMRTRQRLGLPLMVTSDEPARSEDIERQLETGLLDACREAGSMMIKQGLIGTGWMYLRPTGDLELVKDLLSDVPCTPENYDDMVQVLLHEGVDVARGFELMLEHQGTCNSITTYQQVMPPRSRAERTAAATTLLRHFYDELCTAVRDDIVRREAPAADDETLLQMVEQRPETIGRRRLPCRHNAHRFGAQHCVDCR